METPLRRSRRLEGLAPDSPEGLASVSRARRALLTLQSGPEETRQPRSPRSVQQGEPGSPRRRQETSPGSPCLRQDAGLGSPRGQPEPGPRTPQRQPGPGPESPQKEPESTPESPRCQPEPSEESPKVTEGQEELASESAQHVERLTLGAPQHPLQPGPGSPELHPGHQAPGLEPSPPLQELTPEAPGSPQGRPELSRPLPAGKPMTGGLGDLGTKKRKDTSARAPESKKLKEEKEALPVIPKGKPKSGRVWKDRSKKRFSQMIQDKPLRTTWQQKMKVRQERKLAKAFAQHLEEEKERRRKEKKQRRAENLKRRLENERKAEVVQVIRNPAKIKRARKKQLRSIEKRDTLALLQKQPPQQPAVKF
ncbi:coiled-coil domain-containing protein 86 [Carlito syrichta]|uniref:Coiled-coil domain-containing protein 86 n=1 Tax=Carlito syrichta TaxID=1868482 RepID=A0A1U7T039_CARSF|nr:coiled-coil domain-containing protein 86 [Carlito syrichta]